MTTTIQRSMAGGEIAPALYGRTDQAKYATGLRVCRNFLVARHGGAFNRPGTEYIAEVKSSSATVRLVPFIFNSTQTYILEFGNLYVRFYYQQAQVQSGGGAYEVVTPYTTAQLMDLQFAQSADVLTITHPSHAPRDLSRIAHTNWTLSTITIAPTQAAPTNLVITGTAGANTYKYQVTSYDVENDEESLAIVASGTNLAEATTAAPHTLTWTAAAGADEYDVYLEQNGVPGYIGTAIGTTFTNDGIIPEMEDSPPIARNPFSGAGNYPSAVTYCQQRLMFANTDNNPEGIWGSRTGLRNNFTVASPLQDDDAVTFSIMGKEVNEVRHMVEMGSLVVFTTAGEWSIGGDAAGIIMPTAINPKQHSFNGSSTLPPINVGGNVLYLQARGSIVRDLSFEFQSDGYRGNDLTIFAVHLFDGYEVKDWAYQQIPNSIVWLVRDDGTLLGLTYIREHQLWGWHRHDFENGVVENVAVIPEGTEDYLYLVIRRTINGATKRYIERLATRHVTEDGIKDCVFMDSALTYDGRHTGSTTMTLSGGTTWAYDETLTLTASVATFAAGDVGNEYHLTDSSGEIVRCEVTAYTSTTEVSVKPNRTVPVSMRAVAADSWAKAVDQVTGLTHLAGQTVSVFADGYVVGSPNNAACTTYTVTVAGVLTLDRCYSVITVGLPITSDLQTLDIDTVQGETLADKYKCISKVHLFLEASRGIWVGANPPTDDDTDPLEGLNELKIRENEGYDVPVSLTTKVADIQIRPEWNSHGRVFIRQVDPVPVSILTIVPAGFIPFRT